MNRNIVSSLVENLFWILPLIIIISLWEFILPVFIVLVISYILYTILDPFVCFIERLIGIRILSILIVLSILAAPIYIGGNYLYQTINNNYDSITENIINQDPTDKNYGLLDVTELSVLVEERIAPIVPESMLPQVESFFKELRYQDKKDYIANLIPEYFNFNNTIFVFSTIASSIMYILITISFVIMLLANAQNFKKGFIKMVPNRYFEMSLKIIDRISEQISAYIRGTFMAATIVGILSIIALEVVCSMFGMPHDYIILVGVIAGVFNLIPFIGPMIGALSGVLLFILSVEPPDPNNIESASFVIRYYHIIFICIGFAAVQLIDNLLTSPLIISDSVGLHPMFVIIVVLIGGYALGILGMIIAVPFAAILKVIVEELTWGFRNYRYTS